MQKVRARASSVREVLKPGIEEDRFGTEPRMLEVDMALEGEAFRRRHPEQAVLLRDLDGLQHLDRAALLLLFHDACALQEEHERRRTAVHGGDFRPIEFHQRIVDFTARERRHEMLDGAHRDGAFADGRAERGVHHVPIHRSHGVGRGIGRSHRRIGAPKPDTEIRRGGMQGHMDPSTAIARRHRRSECGI